MEATMNTMPERIEAIIGDIERRIGGLTESQRQDANVVRTRASVSKIRRADESWLSAHARDSVAELLRAAESLS